MIEGQTSIFEMLYPTYKIKKPIRLIELFAGYGSQALALKYLGVPFEHWRICEWAVKSIQAYKDIHFTDDNTDYFSEQPFDDDWLISWLYEKGISSNYNDPMTKKQIMRLTPHQRKTIYNNIIATHNLVNIQQVKGEDLGIKETDKFTYLLTYSFPCQDLSLSGKRQLMSDTSTRSGMLWEVERILGECEELPEILLMENVPQVHGEGAIEDFNKWQLRLEELGYKNYWQDLIATDYGIPQTRNRCFMVSVLGDYNYTFPKPIPLKLKLKDLLEEQVDQKYFLSDKQIESLESGSYTASKPSIKLEITDKGLCQTLDTMSGGNRQPLVRTDDINIVGNIPQWHQRGYIYDENNSMTTICATDYKTPKLVKIKNANSKGYLEATEGDGIDISSRMEYHRGTVQKGKTQTLTTMGGENNGVVVKGIATNESEEWQKPPLEEKSRTLLANKSNAGVGCIDTNLRIRKLTPRECFRLMGVKDEDFDKVQKHQSNSSLYHLAGDSIVVQVLMAIFREMI